MSVEDLKSLLPSPLLLTSGETIGVRFVDGEDAASLQTYFRSLSRTSRYNRFMGDVCELSPTDLARMTEADTKDFTVIAEMHSTDRCAIVGEMRYVFDARQRCGEFGLSVGDNWHSRGIGAALLATLERRAAALGVTRLFGESLQSNDKMKQLARKAGFGLSRPAGNWTVVRLEKEPVRWI